MNEACRVCGEPTSEHSKAVCHHCGQPYHLALRQDIPAKDCGEVWISEEFLALEFACNVCVVAIHGGTPAPEPVAVPTALVDGEPKRRFRRREGMRAGSVARGKARERERGRG